jgi:hypothetical protein
MCISRSQIEEQAKGRELQPITNQIHKRIKAAFIEPMQSKPVSALPSGEKWDI